MCAYCRGREAGVERRQFAKKTTWRVASRNHSRTSRATCRMSLLAFSLVMVFLSLGLVPAPAAGPPGGKELTPEQRKELLGRIAAWRARLREEANALDRAGKLAEAIAAVEKVLAVDRRLFGDVHEDIAVLLEWIAARRETREEFSAARDARREVLAIRANLYGEGHWKVADARLALEHVERLAELSPAQRKQLAEAEDLNRKAVRLSREGAAISYRRVFMLAAGLLLSSFGSARTGALATALSTTGETAAWGGDDLAGYLETGTGEVVNS